MAWDAFRDEGLRRASTYGDRVSINASAAGQNSTFFSLCMPLICHSRLRPKKGYQCVRDQ